MVEDDRAQELASLQQQLKAAKESLRLIEVRKSEYVLSTDVPLQLTKETEKKQKEIDRLTRQIAELSQAISSSGGDSSESPTGKTEKHEPVSQSDENIPRRAWALVALLIIDLALLFV